MHFIWDVQLVFKKWITNDVYKSRLYEWNGFTYLQIFLKAIKTGTYTWTTHVFLLISYFVFIFQKKYWIEKNSISPLFLKKIDIYATHWNELDVNVFSIINVKLINFQEVLRF